MNSKMKAAVIAFAMMFLVAFGSTSFAYASTSGGRILDTRNNRIVGVWVETRGGKDGWATYKQIGSSANYVQWSYDTQNRDYRLHIGVGGESWNWGQSVDTGWIPASKQNPYITIVYGYGSGGQARVE